jgi:molecular chaperone GrpE
MENTQPIEPETETTANQQNTPEAAPETTADATTDMAAQLKKVQDELAEAKDKYIRLYSEFENFRRRTSKEKLELIQTASEAVLKNLLPVLDDFERAEKSFKELGTKEAEGILLIYNKYKKVLEQSGLKEMELKTGDDFNADTQEAITQIPAPQEELKGKIVDVVEKGYVLQEKVIRFAKVVVGS